MRNTLLNTCHLKLLFLCAPVRNICKYWNHAALIELVCYAQTSELGLGGWWGYSLYVITCLLLWNPTKSSQGIHWQKLQFALEWQRLWYLAAKISICSVAAECSRVSLQSRQCSCPLAEQRNASSPSAAPSATGAALPPDYSRTYPRSSSWIYLISYGNFSNY